MSPRHPSVAPETPGLMGRQPGRRSQRVRHVAKASRPCRGGRLAVGGNSQEPGWLRGGRRGQDCTSRAEHSWVRRRGARDAVVTDGWVWAVEAESWGHFKEVGWAGGAGKHQGPGPLCAAEGGCRSSEWGQGRAGVSGSEIRGNGPEAGRTQSTGPGQSSDELFPVETDLRALPLAPD